MPLHHHFPHQFLSQIEHVGLAKADVVVLGDLDEFYAGNDHLGVDEVVLLRFDQFLEDRQEQVEIMRSLSAF